VSLSLQESDPEAALALAGLMRVCEPPSASLAVFVARVGPVAAWRAVLTRRAPRPVLAATAARTQNTTPEALTMRASDDLATAEKIGARLVRPGDSDWPAEAFGSFSIALARGVRGAGPPIGLYVRGRPLIGLPGNAVTIVGSRASSAYGQRVAGEMSHELAVRGMTVVSGAAFGIDTAAHRAALHAARATAKYRGDGGAVDDSATDDSAIDDTATDDSAGTRQVPATVAVLACGIDRAYPEANRPMIDEIAVAGSVVSEYPPGTTPARHRFLVRNRLIAAFGAATVVIEAGRRSGTLSTAAAAEQLGRLVMAVPGPVTSAMSVGCHLLLADRFAQLVTGADDVLAALRPAMAAGPGLLAAVPGADPLHPTDGLDLDSARVYDSLPARGWVSLDQVVLESGLLARQVMSALAVLEIHGLAGKEGAAWRRLTPADHA